MKKVVLTGSESSGKTELARRLGEHYGAPVSEEYVRRRALTDPDKLGWEYQSAIAEAQKAEEDATIARATDLVILDTDLFSTEVYAEHYFGRCPEWIAREARARAGSLYLLLAPDVPWIHDGVRDRGDRRDEMHALFAAKLRSAGVRYVEIGGDREQRFAAARQAIDASEAGGASM
jgi:NadR type nicotinamide-nucleotide adenylyltransferase